jgi:hypothetical protein
MITKILLSRCGAGASEMILSRPPKPQVHPATLASRQSASESRVTRPERHFNEMPANRQSGFSAGRGV